MDLLHFFTPARLEEGKEYWRDGLVSETVHGNGSWQGTVAGTLGHYRVRLKLVGDQLVSECSCLDRSGYCKHAAALLWGWSQNPDRFLATKGILQALGRLSPGERFNLLRRLVIEEGALLHRLLTGDRSLEKKRALSGKALYRLVKSLGRSYGSPWFNWRIWQERFTGVTQLLESELRRGTTGAWEALLLFAGKALDLFLITPQDTQILITPYLMDLLKLLSMGRRRLPDQLLIAITKIYLTRPLEQREEEEITSFLVRMLLPEKGEILLREGSIFEEKETNFVRHRRIRLMAAISLYHGDEEAMADLIAWCLKETERLPSLLDLLTEKGRHETVQELLRAALAEATTSEDRFFLRSRLARNCRLREEKRQALYLEVLNFEERPGRAEYRALKDLALELGEWETVKTRLRSGPRKGR